MQLQQTALACYNELVCLLKSPTLQVKQLHLALCAGDTHDYQQDLDQRCLSLAAHFGDEVEFDILFIWSKPFALMLDVATRYKVAFELPSREATDILQGIYTHWIRFFGPMKNFISDQETGLTGHHVAAEFERLGIARHPKGATNSTAGSQHTGTGVVERHVGLIKLTMLKIRQHQERERQPPPDQEGVQEPLGKPVWAVLPLLPSQL